MDATTKTVLTTLFGTTKFDDSFDITKYNDRERNVLYHFYRNDYRFRSDIPLSRYIKWLSADDQFKYIPNNMLTTDERKQLIVSVHHVKSDSYSLNPIVRYAQRKIIRDTFTITAIGVGKLLEDDWKSIHDPSALDKSVVLQPVYYEAPGYETFITTCVERRSVETLYCLNDDTKEAEFIKSCKSPDLPREIITRYFDSDHPTMPRHVINALNGNAILNDVITMWARRWYQSTRKSTDEKFWFSDMFNDNQRINILCKVAEINGDAYLKQFDEGLIRGIVNPIDKAKVFYRYVLKRNEQYSIAHDLKVFEEISSVLSKDMRDELCLRKVSKPMLQTS